MLPITSYLLYKYLGLCHIEVDKADVSRLSPPSEHFPTQFTMLKHRRSTTLTTYDIHAQVSVELIKTT